MIQLLMLGTGELLIIGAAILLLFGGKKIPELMRSLGQGVRNFKEGMNNTDSTQTEEGGPQSSNSPTDQKETTRPNDGAQA